MVYFNKFGNMPYLELNSIDSTDYVMFMLCSYYDPSTARYSKNRDIIVDIKV